MAVPTPTIIPEIPDATGSELQVQRGDVIKYLDLTGRVRSALQQELFFRADGRIRTVYVKVGDEVQENSVLADLETLHDFELQRRYDQLALRRAEIGLEQAELDLEQVEKLLAPSDNSYEYEIQSATHRVELARIALEEAQLQVENRDLAIRDAQIISPMDGVVLSLELQPGDMFTAYETGIIIADPHTLEIGAALRNEEDLALLEEGQVVQVERGDIAFEGTITSLPFPYGSGAENSTPPIRVSKEDGLAEYDLAIGAQVQLTLVAEASYNVLWLPSEAIRIFQERTFVLASDGEQQRRINVRRGIITPDRVEIVTGLTEGQTIFIP